MASLVDLVGSAVIFAGGSPSTGVSLEITVSYLNAVRENEEIEIETKVLSIGETTGCVTVEVRRKATREEVPKATVNAGAAEASADVLVREEEAAAARGTPRKAVGTLLMAVRGRKGCSTGHGDHVGGATIEASIGNLMASSCERPTDMTVEAKHVGPCGGGSGGCSYEAFMDSLIASSSSTPSGMRGSSSTSAFSARYAT
ncbi:hypothetical protein QYE76_056951 [Lolium multiflorum]|uniref:Thioesterase domain-containing protein n=1 Tax=Lolium multiflorum TaxID=4521 RepID=A0AAD8T318_LOLMU|nr:hypothetical protein QYE76_056951 [Lolium multiflorum]